MKIKDFEKTIIVLLVFCVICLGLISKQKMARIKALEEELNDVSVERNNYMEQTLDDEKKIEELEAEVEDLKAQLEEATKEEEVVIEAAEVIVEEPVVETEPEPEIVEEEPEVVEEEPVEEEVVEETASNLTYLGTFEMTAYEWTGNPCANGNYPTCGYTVACNSLPLGTQVYIEGYGYYVVEDRGASWHGDNWMDMYLGDVSACYQWGIKYLDVYLVE